MYTEQVTPCGYKKVCFLLFSYCLLKKNWYYLLNRLMHFGNLDRDNPVLKKKSIILNAQIVVAPCYE